MSDNVLVALITTTGLVVVAWMQFGIRRDAKAAREGAEKAVEQTEHTSNGFAQHMRDQVAEIVDRLDNQDAARHKRDAAMNMLIAKLDDRLVNIEEKL